MVLVVKCLICSKELTYIQGDPSILVAHFKFEHSKKDNGGELNIEEIKKKLDKAKLINQIIQTDLKISDMNREDKPAPDCCTSWHQKKQNNVKNKQPRTSSGDDNAAQKVNNSEGKSLYLDAVSETSNSMTSEQPNAKIIDYDNNETERTPLFKNLKESLKKDKSYKVKLAASRESSSEKPEAFKKRKIYYRTSVERWKPIGDMKIHCPRCHAYKRPVVKASKEHVSDSSIASAFFMACLPLYCSPCCFLPQPNFEVLRCSTCDFEFGIYDHKREMVFPNPNFDLELM